MRSSFALRLVSISILTCMTGFFVGCSPSNPTYEVKGKVTLDGKPMTEGIISFEANPPDGQPPASGPIKDGTYTVQATPGKKTVRISFEKEVEVDMGGGEKEKMPKEIVDAKFNSESTQTAEVTSTGPNEYNFQAKSAKR